MGINMNGEKPYTVKDRHTAAKKGGGLKVHCFFIWQEIRMRYIPDDSHGTVNSDIITRYF